MTRPAAWARIPIEAALLDPRADVAGFDLEPAAVSAARANARRAGTYVRLAVADATRLPLADDSANRIVVNPPWGEAVALAGGLRRPGAPWREASRVLAPDGRLVVLAPAGGGDERGLQAAGLAPRAVGGAPRGAETVILAATPA